MDTHTVTNVTNVTSTQRADDPVVYTTLGLSIGIVTLVYRERAIRLHVFVNWLMPIVYQRYCFT